MVFGSVETLSFQQIANHLSTEGTVPVPPEPPLRFVIVSYYLFGVIAPTGRPRGGSVSKMYSCKHRTAPPCLGEALRRVALIKLQGVMIFMVRV